MEQETDLSALSSFDLVVRHGGFGRAAAASGRSKATLSRHVRTLEEQLGLRLLNRGGHAFTLTEEGRALHERTHEQLSEIAMAVADLKHDLGPPRGELRISCPQLFAHQVMGQLAADFTRSFPAITLDITVEDREVDLIEEGYDLVIRINPQADSRLVGRCLMRNPLHLVAAPDLAPPSGPSRVPLVTRRRVPAEQSMRVMRGEIETEIQTRSVLALPSLLMVRDAVLAGGLAAALPRWLVGAELEAGRLRDWGQLCLPPDEVWVLHASRRLTSRKVKAFIEFLTERAMLSSIRAGFDQSPD